MCIKQPPFDSNRSTALVMRRIVMWPIGFSVQLRLELYQALFPRLSLLDVAAPGWIVICTRSSYQLFKIRSLNALRAAIASHCRATIAVNIYNLNFDLLL